MYKDMDYRKKNMKEFIRKNPKTTCREIKNKLGTKIERLYFGGMQEAFEDANVKFPRMLKKKTIRENKEIIKNFIRKNPKAGSQTISKKTGINVCSVFKGIQKAYEAAGIEYPRKSSYSKTADEKRKDVIELIQQNPLITTNEIIEKTGVLLHRLFGSFDKAYGLAGIKNISGQQKRNLKIKSKIIDFIKENPLATQREINKGCNTHVQGVFGDGIFEAYRLAGVKFPFERLKLYGVGLKEIRKRAKDFEEKIALKLSGFGLVNQLVRSKRGVADIVFERKGVVAIIEIKDYCRKDISCGQINQLHKYLEDFDCNLGFLICHKKPKKNRFLIDKREIFILEEREIKKIPLMMGV